ILLLPGKKHITALRLEVLPDDRQPEKGLGRASDGRFILSAIEIRNTTFTEGQEPPLVYVSRAEADINQKPKEDPAAFDMMPGTIESAIVTEPVGPDGAGAQGMGGWCIVDDERKKPHEAIFLPLEPLDTNEASVLRLSLHHLGSFKFKSLIGRFRISYTEDNRIRELLLPAQTKLWSSVGPFPAEDVTKAYSTAFEPEKDVKKEPLDLKKSYTKIVLPPPQPGKGPAGQPAPAGKPGEAAKPGEGANAASTPAKPETDKPQEKPAPQKDTDKAKQMTTAERTDQKKSANESAKPAEQNKETSPAPKPKPKPEKITWAEQRKWRDGSATQL